MSIDHHVEARADRQRPLGALPAGGETVEVRLAAATVEVFRTHRRVASHLRSHTPGHITHPAHVPDSHRRHAQWTLARIIAWAERTGPATAKPAESIISRPSPRAGFPGLSGDRASR